MEEKQLFIKYNQKEDDCGNYIITGNNAKKVNLFIDNKLWSHEYCLFLYGESGSGKTHLANFFTYKNNFSFIRAKDFNLLINKECIIDNIENFNYEEKDLLASINNAKLYKKRLLLISNINPYNLNYKLPDLNSRIKAIPILSLDMPDDATLEIIISKEFYLRNIKFDQKITQYILTHSKRDVNYLKKLIDYIDKTILSSYKKISVQTVANAMKDFID
ncbi:MAG: hypothetical protein OEY79_00590 [Anaplasmataceae bacterium]|nr:hypothetical protein [Anaplasmataceae bacterium]